MFDQMPIPSFSQARVLVYGDIMLDRYWLGEASRLSPEAPVPVVRVEAMQARPGGAANVALNVASLGAQSDLFGLVGCDEAADELQRLLADAHVACHFQSSPERQTTTKLRVLGQNQQLLRLDFEKAVTSFDHADLMERCEKKLQEVQVLVLSDYAKGALQNSHALIALAKAAGVLVLVDPKQNDFSHYRGATLVTPNYKEFVAAVGPCRDEAEMIQKAKQEIARHDFEALLITRGKEGMLLVEKNGNTLALSAHAREVYDVTGAGDTVIGVMAASLAAGCDVSHSAMLANLAAGLVVRKLGAATVTEGELRRECQKENETAAGIVSETELMHLVEEAKAKQEKIVFTNGCFDVIHAGHIQYLKEAKKLGDRLIIAINTDESIRRLKGESRPLNSLSARMEVLAALRSVDWVVPFSDDTPARLIAKVLPDILVKGADYEITQIAGHEVVLANGGEVKTVPLKAGFSTTKLIEKIQGVQA